MHAPPALRRPLLALLLLLPFAAPAVAASDPAGPTAVVERLHDALLTAMKEGARVGFAGRVEQIGPVLDETFNFETIGRVVTGKHWKTLAAEQRAAFLRTFRKLSTSTYADNFSSYDGERFETIGEEAKQGASVVRTQIVKRDGKTVSLNYVLQKAGEHWRIVNVIADGVSDLALKRSEYAAVIGKEGIDALIARLDAKIASYFANNK